MDKLKESYMDIKTQLQRSLEMRDAQEADLRLARKEIMRLEQENKFLRVSHRLASSPDDIIEARRTIVQMMRSIDKCIAQLKE